MKIQTLEHGVTSVLTSGEASRSRYTETYYNWSIQIIRGHYIVVKTYLHMNMAINIYEYRRGGKCVYMMFRYTYAGIRLGEMKIQWNRKIDTWASL